MKKSKKQRKKAKARESETLASQKKRDKLESRLRILKLMIEIPLISTAIIIAIDKILKL